MAGKQYREWTPDQSFLLPPSPSQWLAKDHLVYFVRDVVGMLDIAPIEQAIQAKDPRGERPWNPRMMLALLIYGYCVGVRSSRRLERATHEDVAVRVLTAGNHPDHTAISEFRRKHLHAFKALFLQALLLCQQAGLVKLGRVALDGTKVQANASKHKAMSYERMKKRRAELEAEIARMLQEAEASDAEEDALHGDRRGDELPGDLVERRERLARLKAAQEALEAEAKAAREAELLEREQAKKTESEEPKDPPAPPSAPAGTDSEAASSASPETSPPPGPPMGPALPSHKVDHYADGTPTPKAQRNFTDPDSRIMKKGHDFVQGYNAQAVVDEAHQVIVAQAVTNQAPDVQHLPAMVAATKANCGHAPYEMLADAGYWSAANVEWCERHGIDPLISVKREKHALDGASPWPAADPRSVMLGKLQAPPGRASYARRKAIVEPVFGQMKEGRGFRRFLLRGLEKVRGEWTLACLCHNLLKLFRNRPVLTMA
jgi:transposase